jgi:hypothetical protein
LLYGSVRQNPYGRDYLIDLDCATRICYRYVAMKVFSTTKAAEKLGMHRVNLQNAIKQRKLPAPKLSKIGGVNVRLWTTRDIERARRVMRTAKKNPN